ncbi:MAG: cytochrome c biogenesis protein CcdA [Phototrophicales bacterium]|nr:cytochrome c biogenesis protein CcdA [Phototrophicales bacterium]
MLVELSINFLVGLVSFLSPCVLPLVPAYISYMGGRMTYAVSAQVDIVAEAGGTAKLRRTTAMRLSTFLHGLAFVGGFTFVFVVLTILATAFIQQIGSTRVIEGMIGRIGGAIIIFLGFHFMGALPALFKWLRKNEPIIKNPLFSVGIALFLSMVVVWGFTGAIIPFGDDRIPLWTVALSAILLAILWTFFVGGGAFTKPASFWHKAMNTIEITLYADTRRQIAASGTQGLAGSALLGVVFAAGWSPCIGPTLGAAMTLAAQQDVNTAILLITAYCLGLGIPFLITALMLDSAQGLLRRLNKHMNKIKVFSGIILVAIGILVASGQLAQLSARFSGEIGGFSYTVDECLYALQQNEINGDQLQRCLGGEDYNTLVNENRAQNPIPAQPEPEITPEAVEPTSMLPTSASSIRDTASQLPTVGLAVGQTAPDFSATTATGEVIRLADLRGKTVLLNFWFTTCAPCKVEMPAFQNAYETNADNDFVVVAVNREESAEAILAFGTELSLTFPLVLDTSGALQARYNIIGYPTTYLINPDGVIINFHTGPLSEARIAELLASILS